MVDGSTSAGPHHSVLRHVEGVAAEVDAGADFVKLLLNGLTARVIDLEAGHCGGETVRNGMKGQEGERREGMEGEKKGTERDCQGRKGGRE